MVALGTLLAVLGVLLGAAPAQAAVDNVVCSGNNTVRYTPPLTNQPQNVKADIKIDWGLCVSPSTPGLKSGTSASTLTLNNRSCAQLLAPSTQTIKITWNTGQTSVYTTFNNASVVGAVYTVTSVGVVDQGLFKNHIITTNYTGPATDILLCTLGLGTVSKFDLVGTLAIAPV